MAEETQAAGGNESEREPRTAEHMLGFKSFIGMYAGEHTAGTELMIGPLFVAAGVSEFDVVVGLFVGNLLAVLSWMYLCAPIASALKADALLSAWREFCGRNLVTLYNIANGVMFCFLAGSMVTVSATALGVWFDFPMPALTSPLSRQHGWVIAVLVVGTLIAIVAAYGYATVADRSLPAPWMVLVFGAFGIIGFREFVNETKADVKSVSDVWHLFNTVIWKGGEPLKGQIKFTFWHVMFFAWFCNMAMHIGMSDLSVTRPKELVRRGVSRQGMYLGHFLAWLCASILYALPKLHRDPANTDVLPGPLAYEAAGVAGAHLRDRCRLDHRQPHYLSGRARVPGDHAHSLTLQSDAGNGHACHARRHVPRNCHETARLCRALRADPHAQWRGHLCRLLVDG